MKRMSSFLVGGGALLVLLVGCRSSGGSEAISATNTTSADLPAAEPTASPVPRTAPMAGNPASAATIVDGEQPSVTRTTSTMPMPQGASVDPLGEPLVTPSLVSPAPLVERGLDNGGTTSPLYSPAQSSGMSTPLPSVSTPGHEQPLVPSTTTVR